MNETIYKTKVVVEIISEQPYQIEGIEQLAADIEAGECHAIVHSDEVNVEYMHYAAYNACQEHGVDPTDFGLEGYKTGSEL